MRLFGQATSGNCWKVRLLLGHLGQDYDYQSLDTQKRGNAGRLVFGHQSVGKIPCLVLDTGETLIGSNAILWRLAQGSPWWLGMWANNRVF